MPWFMIAMLYLWPNYNALLVGLACIVSLFLFALFFYFADGPSTRRTLSTVLTTIGICAALYFCAIVIYPFLITD